MQKVISRGLYGLLFAGGITLLGATAANAADTTGEDGIASGNLIQAPVTAPISLEGNAISLVGDSTADSGRAASAPTIAAPTNHAATTSGEDGIASGNVVSPDVVAPVGVTGNSITLLGDSSATGWSGAEWSGAESAGAAPATHPGEGPTASGADGIASGNLVSPALTAPVDLTGNAIAVLGDSMPGQPGVSESTEPPAPGKAERSAPGTAAASDEGKAASDDAIVRRGPVSLIGNPIVVDARAGTDVSERNAGPDPMATDPMATGPGATSPDATSSDATESKTAPPALTPCDINVAGSAGAVLASSTTPTGTSPAEMLLLVTSLLFGAAAGGLLWKVNRR